jgi:hypothetical protein
VAQELREWTDARNNHHQALQIHVEFGDRYFQASTYHRVGSIAFDLEEIPVAQENWLRGLQMWEEFSDNYSIQTFSLPGLAQIHQLHPNPKLLTAVATILNLSELEVQQLFAATHPTP